MISLKLIAWLFVILVQAVIHFGLVGRKKRMENREKELPRSEEAGTELLKNGHETHSEGTKGKIGMPIAEREISSIVGQASSMKVLAQDDSINNSTEEEEMRFSTKPLHEANENKSLEQFQTQYSENAFYYCRKSTDSVATAETVAEPVDEDSDYDDDEQWRYELQQFENEHESVETIQMLTVKMRSHDMFDHNTGTSSNLKIDEIEVEEGTHGCRPESESPDSGTLILPMISC